MTTRQRQIFKLFITNFGQIISGDQIADVMWPDGSNFSPWAIVKEIARIRKHIIDAGISGHILQSHRKLGYSLS
jgi:DNA-binding response OmpR family regulator